MCYSLNWQLACHFFSANHLSYRIVTQSVILSAIRRSEAMKEVILGQWIFVSWITQKM